MKAWFEKEWKMARPYVAAAALEIAIGGLDAGLSWLGTVHVNSQVMLMLIPIAIYCGHRLDDNLRSRRLRKDATQMAAVRAVNP